MYSTVPNLTLVRTWSNKNEKDNSVIHMVDGIQGPVIAANTNRIFIGQETQLQPH